MKKVLICIDCEGSKEEIMRLVDTIREEEIRATFFVVGETAKKYPDLFIKLAQKYQIESHTYSHINLRKLSKDDQKKEIIKVKKQLNR